MTLSFSVIPESPHASSGDPGTEMTNGCTFKSAVGGEKDLFTYRVDVIHVMDGDTFQGMVDPGFGLTTLQTFRLWGLDAPEINTKAGRVSKKALEDYLASKPVMIRAMSTEKYGRYLADVFVPAKTGTTPSGGQATSSGYIYVNQALIDRGLAAAQPRAVH